MGYCVSYLHEPYHFAIMEFPVGCRHVVVCTRPECVTIGSRLKAGKSECHALHLVPFLVSHGTQPLLLEKSWGKYPHLATFKSGNLGLWFKKYSALMVSSVLGGGNSNIFNFHPVFLAKMIQFDEHIFQMGWFNHQLVFGCLVCLSKQN